MTNRRRIDDKPNDPAHGTVGGYCNNGCRCVRCRKAQAKALAEWRKGDTPGAIRYRQRQRERRVARLAAKLENAGVWEPPHLQPHGTRAAYLRHRRRGEDPCGPCGEAFRKYERERGARRRKSKRTNNGGRT